MYDANLNNYDAKWGKQEH